MIPPLNNKKILQLQLVISPLLLCVAYHTPTLWWLSLFLMLPFFCFLNQKDVSNKSLIQNSLLFGWIYMAGILLWYWSALPLDWLKISSPELSYCLVGIVWLMSSFVFALGFVAFALIYYRSKTNTAFDILLAAALWISAEWFRAFLFSLFVAGPVSLTGAHWTLGFLGYLAADSNLLLPLASVGGVYLLSFCIVAINALVYSLIFTPSNLKQKAITILIFAIAFVSISSFSTPASENEGKSITVGVIHTNDFSSASVTTEQAQQRYATSLELINDAASQSEIGILIFPEDDRFLFRLKKFNQEYQLADTFKNREVLIISSSYSLDGNPTQQHKYAEFSAYNTQTQKTQTSQKTLLMPQGEYLPWIVSYSVKLLGLNIWLDSIADTRNYSNAAAPTLLETHGIKIGALFCAELMSPQLYQSLVNQGAQILVNASSHGSFHGSELLHRQVFQMAKVRAVENNRFLIHAGNVAPSFVIDNHGAVVSDSREPHNQELIYASVEARKSKTIYSILMAKL